MYVIQNTLNQKSKIKGVTEMNAVLSSNEKTQKAFYIYIHSSLPVKQVFLLTW